MTEAHQAPTDPPVALRSLRQVVSPNLTRAEQVARDLESQLRDLPPHTRLGTRQELAVACGVAPATLSEALRLLSARGFVTTRPGPGGGIFTAVPPAGVRIANAVIDVGGREAALSDMVHVRAALELPLVSDAVAHRTDGDIADLQAILGRIRTASSTGQAPDYSRAVHELFTRICDITPNRLLASMYLSVHEIIGNQFLEVARRIGTTPDGVLPSRLAVGERLVSAIATGDAPAAAHAVSERTVLVLGDLDIAGQS